MNITVPINIKVYRISIGVFFFVAGLTFSSWASRIPDIKNHLQLSDAGLGIVLFSLPVGQFISLPVSSWLIGKYGSKLSVLIAALLYPATLLLLASVEYTWQLVIGLLIFGFLANLINIAMNTQAVSVEKIYGRSIMASFHGLWSLAGFTGAVIGSLFVSNGLSPMWQFSIISIVAFILVWSSHKYTLDDYNVKKASSPSLFTRPDKYILTLGLIAFCCMLCEGAMADWSGVYFQKVVTTKGISTTIGYVAFTFTMAGGRFLGDWVVAKIGVRQVLKFSGVLIFIGLMVAVLYPSAIVATAGFLLVGLGVSSVVPIIYSLAGKSEHMPASVALSAVSTISFLGFLIGPPLIGFLSELSGMRISFTLIAVLGLGVSLLAGKLK